MQLSIRHCMWVCQFYVMQYTLSTPAVYTVHKYKTANGIKISKRNRGEDTKSAISYRSHLLRKATHPSHHAVFTDSVPSCGWLLWGRSTTITWPQHTSTCRSKVTCLLNTTKSFSVGKTIFKKYRSTSSLQLRINVDNKAS